MTKSFLLLIFSTFLVLGASFGQAETLDNDCASKLKAASPEIDIAAAAEAFSKQLDQMDPQARAEVEARANELLARAQDEKRSLSEGLRSVKDLSLWIAYSAFAYAGTSITNDLRENGIALILTNHYSNAAWGLGLVGITHNAICFTYEACKQISSKLVGRKVSDRFRRFVDSVKKQLAGKRASALNHRSIGLYATALLFTGIHAGFELNGLIDGFNFLGDSGNIDWPDFIAGEIGIVAYVAINRMLTKRHIKDGLISAP